MVGTYGRVNSILIIMRFNVFESIFYFNTSTYSAVGEWNTFQCEACGDGRKEVLCR